MSGASRGLPRASERLLRARISNSTEAYFLFFCKNMPFLLILLKFLLTFDFLIYL